MINKDVKFSIQIIAFIVTFFSIGAVYGILMPLYDDYAYVFFTLLIGLGIEMMTIPVWIGLILKNLDKKGHVKVDD